MEASSRVTVYCSNAKELDYWRVTQASLQLDIHQQPVVRLALPPPNGYLIYQTSDVVRVFDHKYTVHESDSGKFSCRLSMGLIGSTSAVAAARARVLSIFRIFSAISLSRRVCRIRYCQDQPSPEFFISLRSLHFCRQYGEHYRKDQRVKTISKYLPDHAKLLNRIEDEMRRTQSKMEFGILTLPRRLT